jgi:thiol-disulfide isomerase/thioredoxin
MKMRFRFSFLVGVALALTALLAGPAPLTNGQTPETGKPKTDPSSAKAVTDDNAKTASTEIRQIDLAGLKSLLSRDGQDARPLLINFWATWCDPCREEFPDLVKIDADYGAKKLNFVAISLDDVSDLGTAVPKFLKEMKASMPVVLLSVNDPEPAIKMVDLAWDGQLPATFLYDKDGQVVFKYFGRLKPDQLRAAIDKQIGSK